MPLTPDPQFAATLDRLAPEGRLGVAVSGGPDSLALLLLATAARPGQIEAATVDHGLRDGSRDEAAMVAQVCADLGVPHETLTVTVSQGASVQAQARDARYAALSGWAERRGLAAVATAHHADDQAETVLMRLARGSGVGGLAGIRERRMLSPGVALLRPLLGWRKSALVTLVEAAGLIPANDPTNKDPRHDRTRVRSLLASGEIDALRVGRSAQALGDAVEALEFVTERMKAERIVAEGANRRMAVADLPAELQRRLLLACLADYGAAPSGPDIDRALVTLRNGEICTLAGVKLEGGAEWRLTPAPPRRA